MRNYIRIKALEHIDDIITKENAEEVAGILRERIGERPFDLTIRNALSTRPIVSIGLKIDKISVEEDGITIWSESGSAGVIELDRSKYSMLPRISINHMRVQIVQFLPHKIEWSILLR